MEMDSIVKDKAMGHACGTIAGTEAAAMKKWTAKITDAGRLTFILYQASQKTSSLPL